LGRNRDCGRYYFKLTLTHSITGLETGRPAQQNILSGRAGCFVKSTGPGGPDVLSGWPGPIILSFIFIFPQLFCFL
jgi:hypothetical protein